MPEAKSGGDVQPFAIGSAVPDHVGHGPQQVFIDRCFPVPYRMPAMPHMIEPVYRATPLHASNCVMRVLIAVPRLAMPGGVANYYKTLRPYLDEQKVYFEIGGIPGETGGGRSCVVCSPTTGASTDCSASRTFDLVHINPSMDLRSAVPRRLLLLMLARTAWQRVLVFYRGWFPHVEAEVRQRYPRLFRLVYGKAHANIVLAGEFRSALAEMGVSPPTFIETTVVDDAVFAGDAARWLRGDEPRSAW